MKTTNAVIEATASEHIYIATKVRTEEWKERTEINISTLECTGMAAVTQMFAHNSKCVYVVTNLATGEKRTYGRSEFREWCMSQTLDNMANYRITVTAVWDRARLHGRGEITHEVYFTRVTPSDVDADEKHTADGTHMVEDVPLDF